MASKQAVVQIQGARELRRQLNRLDRELTSAGMKRVHMAVADLVVKEAVKVAPRRTGRLAGDIRAQATTRSAIGAVGRTSVPYAGPIHWGWPSRPNPDRGWRGGPIAANRFLYRATQQPVLGAVVDTYEDGIGDLLSKVGLG